MDALASNGSSQRKDQRSNIRSQFHRTCCGGRVVGSSNKCVVPGWTCAAFLQGKVRERSSSERPDRDGMKRRQYYLYTMSIRLPWRDTARFAAHFHKATHGIRALREMGRAYVVD
jgi:hypothetical protein